MKLLFQIVICILIEISPNVYAKELPEELEVSVYYRNFSHQNSWEKSFLKQEKAHAIQINRNQFLVIASQNSHVEYAEILSDSGKSNTKLQLIAFDPDTGLSLFDSSPFVVSSKIFQLDQFDFDICKKKMKEDFTSYGESEFFFKGYSSKGFVRDKENTILYKYKNYNCGIQFGSKLFDLEYLREFYKKKKKGRIFFHPGFLVKFNLSEDEKEFYFGKKLDGVVVEKIYPGFGPIGLLQPQDAVIEVNGVTLQGNPIEKKRKFFQSILYSNKKFRKKDEPVNLTIRRNKKTITQKYFLKHYSDENFLIPEKFENEKRLFFIEGGLVFSELSGAYLKESGKDYRRKSHKKLLYIYEFYKYKSHPFRKRIVIVNRILPDDFNINMRNLEDEMVQKANGENVISLTHLFAIFQRAKSEILLEFSNGEFFVFNKEEIFLVNENIKKLYSLNHLSNIVE
ncbi:MAG: hypothetical protein L6Q54_07235 [Leptospiraceae bacterium]|nr:hypothetical protein [Leptospiraceae bacterium]MCK6381029.1 hypothetical protein [Leptospiraceae bacterium]NUM41431.1 hypothetical protein [Leptospiraceae bacterium]